MLWSHRTKVPIINSGNICDFKPLTYRYYRGINTTEWKILVLGDEFGNPLGVPRLERLDSETSGSDRFHEVYFQI